MDFRWKPVSRDSQRKTRVIIHPTASLTDVRRGLDSGSDDSVDVSDFVTQGTHTAFDANISLSFNRELFGTAQPAPNQVLEIQLWESRQANMDGEWKPIWIGIIDAINSFTLQRGTRSMQLTAKSREQQDIWKNVKRVTPLYPQLTNFTYIAERIARSVGLVGDEILIPVSAWHTVHSNTQMGDMNAWDMLTQLFLPMGLTPFMDSMQRLRAADRTLQGRTADIILDDSRLVKVGGQRTRPPKSRIRLQWLNPTLKKDRRQRKVLTSVTVTLGWFMPYYHHTVWFSDDRTQRAEDTKMVANPSCNAPWIPFKFVKENYHQQTENKGQMSFINFQSYAALGLIAARLLTSNVPDTMPHIHHVAAGMTIDILPSTVVPTGRRADAIASAAFMTLMLAIGTGNYEIWGIPFEWIHARNTSEAFDSSVPLWVDNVAEIECDFVTNEAHAKMIVVRELIYQAREANKWTVTLVDDPRIEYGDILQFHDGSQFYVLDFNRNIERGSEATLDVSGFLVGPAALSSIVDKITDSGAIVPSTSPGGGGITPPGGGSGGGGGETPLPAFPASTRATGIGVFGEPDAPGLAIVLGDGSVDPKYPVTPKTEAVFTGSTGNLPGTLALASSLSVPALYYIDDYGLRPSAVPAGFRPALYCYPRSGVPVADTVALLEQDMLAMQTAGMPFDLVVAGYRQFKSVGVYSLTEAQVLQTMERVWVLSERYQAGAWWIFHHGRFYFEELVDGVTMWPKITESVALVRAASADWHVFP